ncbi:uncharacterized protein ciroz [Scleropages formosus]|uniref:uncharacterized protein ciroz n=1 Tax=Scleropages formosus TaxID=113540 RepID=UPI0010FABCC7|nr:uncharacterized protein C1orf127 homolog [Scleropages formosus]
METVSAGLTEGDVECFSEYMELWVHRMRIEGLRLWLSGALRIPVSLASLDDLNGKLSACGFSLYRDPDRNYVFRVLYSGCFVHLEHGNYVVSLSLTKRTSRFGSRSSAFAMKCPLVRAPPSGEHVMCDSDFIQVTRRIPTDSWNNELPWSLALRGKVVVALEDASLIRLSVETDGVNITVQGRRAEILSPEEVLDTPGTFLPLRLVSGHYSYSMEASCPTGSDSPVDETVLYIYKRRMGLVKRGGGDGEVLSLSAISVKQTDSFSVFESSDLVRIALNTSLILRTRRCMGPAGKQLIQPFFRVDAVLTFKETPHHLVWSLENLLPCTESSALSTAATETLVSSASSGSPTTPSAGRTAAAHSANPAFRWPASTVARLLPKAVDQGSEVKDSAAEPSTEMVIGVETSSTPPHVSEEGAGWLSRNTSMEGQAKHVTLFPESPDETERLHSSNHRTHWVPMCHCDVKPPKLKANLSFF